MVVPEVDAVNTAALPVITVQVAAELVTFAAVICVTLFTVPTTGVSIGSDVAPL